METALSTINQLPSGSKQVKQFFAMLKEEILSGTENPLKILIKLKYAEKVIADILKDEEIEASFLREFALYEAEKVVEMDGAKLTTMEAGVSYAYEESGDPVWLDLDRQIKELAEKKKERENFLKTIPYEGTIDPGTGVYITRPPKRSKTKVQVRLT